MINPVQSYHRGNEDAIISLKQRSGNTNFCCRMVQNNLFLRKYNSKYMPYVNIL